MNIYILYINTYIYIYMCITHTLIPICLHTYNPHILLQTDIQTNAYKHTKKPTDLQTYTHATQHPINNTPQPPLYPTPTNLPPLQTTQFHLQ